MADSSEKPTSFFPGFLKLFSGLMIVQLLNFGFSLILPRFYSPEDYALLGIFTAVVFILAEIVALKLELTIFFPKADKDALEIVHVIFLVSLLFSVSMLFGCIPLSIYYNQVFILLPAVLLIYGFSMPLSTWFTRKQEYKKLNTYRVIIAISTPLISLLFILYMHWGFGLVLGFIAGQFFGLVYLFFSFDQVRVRWMNFTLLKKYIQLYKQFPTLGVGSTLVNSFSRNSIVIFIERFFGVMNAGYYTMASRLLNAPAGMYQSSLSQIYAQQAAQMEAVELKSYTKKIVRFGFLLGIVPSIVIFLFGPVLFKVLFGLKWVDAGVISQFVIFWFFSMAIINPVGLLIDIKQKLKFELGWNIVLLVLRLGSILLGIISGNFYLMLLILSAVGIVMNLFLLWYVLKLAGEKN